MKKNIIELFSKGNKELFHSAFLAWLLNKNENHDLGDYFISEILKLAKLDQKYNSSSNYNIVIEYVQNKMRFDIYIGTKEASNDIKGIVIENKIKSFGNEVQFKKYREKGYDVVGFALLGETLNISDKTPIIYYSDILNILKNIKYDKSNHYHFLIREYIAYLQRILDSFDILKSYVDSKIGIKEFKEELQDCLKSISLKDNDVRTYDYYYYYNFAQYLKDNVKELIFGTDDYNNKFNTRWIFKKNQQGPPYVECLICDFHSISFYKLDDYLWNKHK